MLQVVVRSNPDGEKFISCGEIEMMLLKNFFIFYDAIKGYFQHVAGTTLNLSPFPFLVKSKKHSNRYVWIDEWMLPILAKYHVNYNATTGYVQCKLKSDPKSSPISLQRLVLQTWPWLDVDHIDQNKNNYVSANLLAILHADNIRKQKNHKSHAGKPTSSEFRGVSWNTQSQKWYASIVASRLQLNLGNYENPNLSAAVYNYFAERLFGEFAVSIVVK